MDKVVPGPKLIFFQTVPGKFFLSSIDYTSLYSLFYLRILKSTIIIYDFEESLLLILVLIPRTENNETVLIYVYK